jgi:carbon storage regulator
MVIIRRKQNESIVINDTITITVIEVQRDKVRLGIVHREYRSTVWRSTRPATESLDKGGLIGVNTRW